MIPPRPVPTEPLPPKPKQPGMNLMAFIIRHGAQISLVLRELFGWLKIFRG